jgi:hypothetical protein
MLNPDETHLEKLLLQEATEVYNYYSCVQQESNSRIKALWERFLDYELGHFQVALRLFKDIERRDPAEVLGSGALPPPIEFKEHRKFVRDVLDKEEHLRKNGTAFVGPSEEGPSSTDYRNEVNRMGSPSTTVSEGYVWTPGTELARLPLAA